MSKPRKTHKPRSTSFAPDFANPPPTRQGRPHSAETLPKTSITRNSAQKLAAEMFPAFPILFLLGPAGSGKTHSCVSLAWSALMRQEVERIVVTRPAVECSGESLGFLPGDIGEKMHPYLMPYQDVLRSLVGESAPKVLSTFEVLPLAYVRGRTLDNCVAILDEAQNCNRRQLHSYLTRVGENGHLLIAGDPRQSDLHTGGADLIEVARELEKEGVAAVIEFTDAMIVRSPYIARIERSMDRINKRHKA